MHKKRKKRGQDQESSNYFTNNNNNNSNEQIEHHLKQLQLQQHHYYLTQNPKLNPEQYEHLLSKNKFNENYLIPMLNNSANNNNNTEPNAYLTLSSEPEQKSRQTKKKSKKKEKNSSSFVDTCPCTTLSTTSTSSASSSPSTSNTNSVLVSIPTAAMLNSTLSSSSSSTIKHQKLINENTNTGAYQKLFLKLNNINEQVSSQIVNNSCIYGSYGYNSNPTNYYPTNLHKVALICNTDMPNSPQLIRIVNLDCSEGLGQQHGACMCSPGIQLVQFVDPSSIDHYENHKPVQDVRNEEVSFIDANNGSQSEQVYELIDDTKINLINTNRNSSFRQVASEMSAMSTSTFKKKYPKTNPNYVKVNK